MCRGSSPPPRHWRWHVVEPGSGLSHRSVPVLLSTSCPCLVCWWTLTVFSPKNGCCFFLYPFLFRSYLGHGDWTLTSITTLEQIICVYLYRFLYTYIYLHKKSWQVTLTDPRRCVDISRMDVDLKPKIYDKRWLVLVAGVYLQIEDLTPSFSHSIFL